jgi:acetyltransferase-like isoleucine patch superfamily enzyme
MTMSAEHALALLVPGGTVPGDWFPGRIPANIRCGEGTRVDSSFAFHRFFSRRAVGLRTGRDVTLWRTALASEEDACIEIGDHSYLANATLACVARISIGAFVMVSGGVTIADSDFHPTSPAERVRDAVAISPLGDRRERPPLAAAEVVIEDDVWIGYNAVVLKGVRVGAGAVIGPGAVVLHDVPAGAHVMGNPATVIDVSS